MAGKFPAIFIYSWNELRKSDGRFEGRRQKVCGNWWAR
jgi:hypothetical protein